MIGANKIYVGKVDWFESFKGFGVVITKSGKDFFIHKSGFKERITLSEGSIVSFTTNGKDKRGRVRTNKIRKVDLSSQNACYCLNDCIESEEVVKNALLSSSIEDQQSILLEQFHPKAIKSLVSIFNEALKLKIENDKFDEVYSILCQLKIKRIGDALFIPVVKKLSKESPLSKRMDFWLGDIYSEEFYSDEFPEIILKNIDILDEEKISKIKSKRNKDVNRLLFEHLISKHLPCDNEQSLNEIKNVLDELRNYHENKVLGLDKYVYENSSLDNQFLWFKENYYSEYDSDYVLKNLSKFSIDEIKYIIKKTDDEDFKFKLLSQKITSPKQLENVDFFPPYLQLSRTYLSEENASEFEKLVISLISIDERFEFWLNGSLKELSFSFIEFYFIREETEVQKNILKKVDEKEQLTLMIAFLEKIEEVSTEEKYLQVLPLLKKESYYSTFLKNREEIIESVLPFFSPRFKFKLFIDNVISRFEKKYVLNNLSTLSFAEFKHVFKEENDEDLKFKLLSKKIIFPRESTNIEFFPSYLGLSREHLNRDKADEFEKQVLGLCSNDDQYKLWLEGIIEQVSLSIIEGYFLQEEVEVQKEILRKVDEEDQKSLMITLMGKFDKISTEENYLHICALLKVENWYEQILKNKDEIIECILPYFSSRYKFKLWFDGFISKLDKDYVTSNFQNFSSEEILKTLGYGNKEINALILRQKINLLKSNNTSTIEELLKLYDLIWKYDLDKQTNNFQILLRLVSIENIYLLGLEIITPLSTLYSDWNHRGQTFLYIYNNSPKFITDVNSRMVVGQIFRYRNIKLTLDLFQKRIEHLKSFVSFVSFKRIDISNFLNDSSVDLKNKINFAGTVTTFEKEMKEIDEEINFPYLYQLESVIQEVKSNGTDSRSICELWFEGLQENFDLNFLTHYYHDFDEQQKEKILKKLIERIPSKKRTKPAKLRERNANHQLLTNLVDSYLLIMQSLYPDKSVHDLSNLPIPNETILRDKIITLLPVRDDKAFEALVGFLTLLKNYNLHLQHLKNVNFKYDKDLLIYHIDLSVFSDLIYNNTDTKFNIKLWVHDLIEKLDFNNYCFYYFLLTSAEKKIFNKKVKAVMGEEIKSNQLKKIVPWKILRTDNQGGIIYEATWRSIWFLDKKINICSNNIPTFMSFDWEFSTESFNHLSTYISGRKLTHLTIYTKNNVITKIDGLDELEEVIYKAELLRQIKTGKSSPRGVGMNKIPINMLLRNQCVQYLNKQQLKGLEPTHIYERAYRLENSTFSVDVSLLFSIPLKTGEVALIWESLALEKSKATHIFKCKKTEHKEIQNQIETYLNKNIRVRSSLNSKEQKNIQTQAQLKYLCRIDHDNFKFNIWLDKLHDALPAMERVSIP